MEQSDLDPYCLHYRLPKELSEFRTFLKLQHHRVYFFDKTNHFNLNLFIYSSK